MKRVLLISLSLIVLAMLVAGALWWRVDRHNRSFYTDGSNIQQPVSDALVRDVLWQPPLELAGVANSEADEYEPRVSLDGSTLVLVRGKAGGEADLYIAQRAAGTDGGAGWAEPQPIFEINTGDDELAPSLSPDGRTLLFSSNRPGGSGGYDLWLSHRNEFGWGEPVNLGPYVNSEYNEYGAALAPDGTLLMFASNRPAEGESPTRVPGDWSATVRERYSASDYDLYSANITPEGLARAAAIDALNTLANEGAPVLSPAGDFLYFCSDRQGGAGGFDLYRSRRLDHRQLEAERLGGEINTSANEMDPAPEMAGFALIFSSDQARADPESQRAADGPARSAGDYNLWRSESREVFVKVGPRDPVNWAALWALLAPLLLWLLLLLLGLALLGAMWKGVRSRRLSLLMRCLLASVIAHVMLMIIMSFWQVTSQLAQLMDRGGGLQIRLTSAAAGGGGLAGQIRGGMTDVGGIEARETQNTAKIEREVGGDAPGTELVRMQAGRAELPSDQRGEMQANASEAQATSTERPTTNLTTLAAAPTVTQTSVQAPFDEMRASGGEAQGTAPAGGAGQIARSATAPAPSGTDVSEAIAMPPAAAAIETPQPVQATGAVGAAATESTAPVADEREAVRAQAAEVAPGAAAAGVEVDLARPGQGEDARAARVAEAGSSSPVASGAAGSASSRSEAGGVGQPAAGGSGAVALAPQRSVGAERLSGEEGEGGAASAVAAAPEALPNGSAAPSVSGLLAAGAGASASAAGDAKLALPTDAAAGGNGSGEAVAAMPADAAAGGGSSRAGQSTVASGDVASALAQLSPDAAVLGAAGAVGNETRIGAGQIITADSAGTASGDAAPSLPQSNANGALAGAGTADATLALPADLANPSGALAQGAATQPSVGAPGSALASASARQDGSIIGAGGEAGPASAAVALAPGSVGDSGSTEAQLPMGAVAGATESTGAADSAGSSNAPGSDRTLGEGLPQPALATGAIALPGETGGAQETGGERDGSGATALAAAGSSSSSRAGSVLAVDGAGASSDMLRAQPGVADAAGAANGATVGVSTQVISDAAAANGGGSAVSPDSGRVLGEGLGQPALTLGEIALPGEGLGASESEARGEHNRGGDARSVAIAATGPSGSRADSGSAFNDESSPGASVHMQPDAAGSLGDPDGAGVSLLPGSIADARGADDGPSLDAALPAIALGEMDMPGAADPDIDIRIPTEILPPNNPYAGRTESKRLETVKRMGGSEETERAVAMALEWLARHQSADGRWATRNFDETCKDCGSEGKFDTDIATTGLALLCFLGADHTHYKEGKYQRNVQRGLKWLLDQQKPDGDLRGGETMYSHGIAAIALGEALGMTSDAQLTTPVQRAIEFIDLARNRNVGGWRYEPRQAGDTSVAGWQVMALMSAKRAGLNPSSDAFAAAGAWMETVSFPDMPGRYAYQPGQPWSVSMTAEGMFISQLLGMPRDDARMNGSVAYILENLPVWEVEPNTYYWYYATLAMFQYQGPHWDTWNKTMTAMLLKNQRQSGAAAGSWDPRDNWSKIGGRVYQTAICTLCLEVYYRYLPMYRDGAISDAQSAVTGSVTDARTGAPLAGATVRLDLSSASGALVAVSDSAGRYALALPKLPADFVALSASKDGYTPSTTNIAAAEANNAQVTRDFALAPEQSNVIAIEADPQEHHLGNNEFEGAINSQFQKRAEGLTWQAEFTLGAEHLPPRASRAEVSLMVKGAQAQNSISINGRRLGARMNRAPRDGSFGEFTIEIPLDLLVDGVNAITIRSSNSEADYDDFEFVNVQIRLE